MLTAFSIPELTRLAGNDSILIRLITWGMIDVLSRGQVSL
jgi:hypothetical protein